MYIALILVALLFMPLPSWAAIVCGTANTSTTAADPQTRTHTPDAGTNRIMIVGIATRGDGITISGVSSSAGGTFTQLFSDSAFTGQTIRVGLFYSTDFVDGLQTISVDYSSAPLQGHVGVMTCTGVNTGSPWRAASISANGTSTSTGANLVVSSAAGDLVIDVLALAGNTGEVLTVDASQTANWNVASGVNLLSGSSKEAGAASTQMSWSWVNNRPYIISGASLKPAVTTRPITPIIFQ